MTRQLIVVILLTTPFTYCHKLITILSDFTNDKDVEFFKTTLPWVMDNVGYDVNLKFHFIDSGVNSGPRQCVLSQLTRNTYVQAKYLKCLAEGKSEAECNKDMPINTLHLNRCLRFNVKNFVKNAVRQFQRYKVDKTPFIILPRRKIVVDTSPHNLLKSICALFPSGIMHPIGCTKPSPIPGENNEPGKEQESGESVPGSTPTPDEKETTKQEPKPEDGVKPEQQKPDKNSSPESENKPEKQLQPDEKPRPESGTTPKEPNQPDDTSTPKAKEDQAAKQEEQKQPDNKPDDETKPKEHEDPDKKPSPENGTNSDEQKKPKDKPPQDSGTKQDE